MRENLHLLAKRIIEKFEKVTTAFRAMDIKKRSAVSFSDFAFAIDNLKLDFDRNTILQLFTYLDYDKDGAIKFPDVCNLVGEYLEPRGYAECASDDGADQRDRRSHVSRASDLQSVFSQVRPKSGPARDRSQQVSASKAGITGASLLELNKTLNANQQSAT